MPNKNGDERNHKAVAIFRTGARAGVDLGAWGTTWGTGRIVAKIALLWEQRQFLFRRTAIALVASSIIVFLIPVRYTSTTRLMPPDQAGQGITSMLAAVGKASGDIGGIGGLLGLKTTGDLFVGVLQSRSVADDLDQQV